MERKEFLKKTAAATLILSSTPILNLYSLNPRAVLNDIKFKYEEPSEYIKKSFEELIKWLNDNGWMDYLKSELNLSIQLSNIILEEPINSERLMDLRKIKGFEDFAGNKLIEPGYPDLSLLYHMLASPRVKSILFKQYPDINQIDELENYIYNIGKIDLNQLESENDNLFLAVLAYEYRPAYKTPPFDPKKRKGKRYAQFVYSRCGVARIGEEPYNYDKENRSFTSKPINKEKEKQVAVTPARYGLFLIKLVEVNNSNIKLMNEQDHEKLSGSKPRHFISPITKIVTSEHTSFEFGEFHLNEKLKKLSNYKSKKGYELDFSSFNTDEPPFKHKSCTNDKNESLNINIDNGNSSLVNFTRLNSSVLLSSKPQPIIRFAKQNGKLVNFLLPEENQSERRYSALKLSNPKGKEAYDAVWTDFIFRRSRRTSRFRATRNAPLFANIKFVTNNENEFIHLGGDLSEDEFKSKIENGNYKSVLFEDSICDGCISVNFNSLDKNDDIGLLISNLIKNGRNKILPAFSLVTAPDFFPNLDSNDIRSYYFENSKSLTVDEDFLEGGTLNLSGIRQRGNPSILDPFDNNQKAFADWYDSDKSFDTLTAVIGLKISKNFNTDKKFNLSYKRDYQANSYLPDTGTGIFYPGWDATYSGDKNNPFLATYGLGSPFPEDMKLCAAANGMWPVLSPDAGRTFQGSLDPFPILGKPNTSIPLMDDELGYNKGAAYVKYFNLEATYGWDGEQGPFIEINSNSDVLVNFTDINRADYLENLLDSEIGFDMSKLREIDTNELINRMECMRKCIKTIDNKTAQYTDLWLVASVKINNWDETQKIMCLPTKSVFSELEFNKKQNPELSGNGYFYVFIRENKKQKKGTLVNNKGKRRVKKCTEVWLCQITKKSIAYIHINIEKNNISKWENKEFIVY